MSASPTKKEADRYVDELQQLRNGVANVTLAWSSVENALVQLLSATLNHENMMVPAAMYFALSGIETRIRIVDRALRELLFKSGKEVSADITRIETAWNTIENRLRRLRAVRNKVAHGQIVTCSSPKSGPLGTPRLTSPIWDFAFFRNAMSTGQLPGLGANELNVSQEAVYRVAEKVSLLEEVIRQLHIGQNAGMLQKIANLEASLATETSDSEQAGSVAATDTYYHNWRLYT